VCEKDSLCVCVLLYDGVFVCKSECVSLWEKEKECVCAFVSFKGASFEAMITDEMCVWAVKVPTFVMKEKKIYIFSRSL